jgi:hypothetical protein
VKFAQRSTEDSNDSFRTPGFECPDQKVCDISWPVRPMRGNGSALCKMNYSPKSLSRSELATVQTLK